MGLRSLGWDERRKVYWYSYQHTLERGENLSVSGMTRIGSLRRNNCFSIRILDGIPDNNSLINKDNFGIFLDSMPDSWGRTLMQRREPIRAREEGRVPRKLHDIDFLLGVYDYGRMGALRYKLDPEGPFLEK